MYKSGGYNVYPREIEEVLELHPGVAMAAVIGVPDALYQEVGKAYVLPRYGAEPTAAELEIHCRRHLANYKVPKGFVIKTDLPLLPIGKIDKQALRGLASAT
jgi:acyl-CoA synthetase (AMP-forming)/AMP-acid ligase II